MSLMLLQLFKERRWCFTWQLQIHQSTVTSFTIQSMFKVFKKLLLFEKVKKKLINGF